MMERRAPSPVLRSTVFLGPGKPNRPHPMAASNHSAALELEKTDNNIPRHEIIHRQNATSRDADHSVGALLRGPIFGGPGSRCRPTPGPPPHPERWFLPVRHQV